MRNVDVMQVRAMLKEILMIDGGSADDITAVMTIGTPAMGTRLLNGPSELTAILEAVEAAAPDKEGAMRFNDANWEELQTIYAKRVVTPLFA
jgi:hypothetical protein